MSLFLSSGELRELTGFAFKGKQITQLRKMGIPFFINGRGKPVVAVTAVQGAPHETLKPAPPWQPAVLRLDKKT